MTTSEEIDRRLFEQIRDKLFTSIISDALDSSGFRNQAMSSKIRPIDDALVLVGRARTASFMEVWHHDEGTNPYELEIQLVDSLKPFEIPIFACSNSARIGPWGELLSTAAQARGAAGAVMDGCTRDVRAIRAMKFPVFHGGIAPLDSKGRARIMALDIPIQCGGVYVVPGDLVVGDVDGLVVIPQSVEEKVLEIAFKKVSGESNTLKDLQRGDKLADVFARYGIL
jgi:regulator of RNase E activity RraA